jgi:Gpi18-like mannosyltransferase
MTVSAAGPGGGTQRLRDGLLGAVILPFLISRSLLLLIAFYARRFPFFEGYPPLQDKGARGWYFLSSYLLDAWGRWDASWYVGIALEGYPRGPVTGASRLAFFPLYPMSIRALHSLLPHGWQGPAAAYLCGVVVANVFAVGALAILFRHVRARFGDEALAERSVLYLLAFPTALFLSCAYTESLFLLLAVSTFDAAWRGRWAQAGLLGALLTLTRPNGLLMLAPMTWMFLERIGWSWRRIRLDILWLAAIPAAYLGWVAFCWLVTGDPLASVHVQQYWGRGLAAPWQTLDAGPNYDRVATAGLIAAGVYLVWRRWVADGAFVLLLTASFLFSGSTISGTRFALVAFPIFWLFARFGRNPRFHSAYLAIGVAVQAVFMVSWARMYWVD